MISQFDTSDTNNTQDLFDIGTDFTETLENAQVQTSTSIQSAVPSSASTIVNQQPTNVYQTQQQVQPRLTYIAQTRPQLSTY